MTLESQAVRFFDAFEVTTGCANFHHEGDALDFEASLPRDLDNRHGMHTVYRNDNEIDFYQVCWATT